MPKWSRPTSQAWRYEKEGRNLVGRGQAMVMANATFDALIAESADAWLLYSHLRRHHRGRDFVLTKAMAANGMEAEEVERRTGRSGEARLHLLHPSRREWPA